VILVKLYQLQRKDNCINYSKTTNITCQ